MLKKSLITALVCFSLPNLAFAAGADYDGNGFSEIPVLTSSAGGSYTWTLFDPSSKKTSLFTVGLGKEGDHVALGNWLYPKVTSAGIISRPTAQSGGRCVWTVRTLVSPNASKTRKGTPVIQQQVKYLGRPGEIAMAGGDFDGDGISDAVMLVNRGTGHYKWGLRGSWFLSSYNPGLNINRAYFDFGILGSDKPFYMNPDGHSDWFAILRNSNQGGYEVALTQPFTKRNMIIPVGAIPDGANAPLPVAQEDGTDLMAFYGSSNGKTHLMFKNLSGKTVSEVNVPNDGQITVGNYLPGPGEEVAVSSNGTFFIYNPISEKLVQMNGPEGIAEDSININTVG